MDQLHKSLNNSCFVKPLEGKERKRKSLYCSIQNKRILEQLGITQSPLLLFQNQMHGTVPIGTGHRNHTITGWSGLEGTLKTIWFQTPCQTEMPFSYHQNPRPASVGSKLNTETPLENMISHSTDQPQMLSHLKQHEHNYQHALLLPLPTLTATVVYTKQLQLCPCCYYSSSPCPIPHHRLPPINSSYHFTPIPRPHANKAQPPARNTFQFPSSQFHLQAQLLSPSSAQFLMAFTPGKWPGV